MLRIILIWQLNKQTVIPAQAGIFWQTPPELDEIPASDGLTILGYFIARAIKAFPWGKYYFSPGFFIPRPFHPKDKKSPNRTVRGYLWLAQVKEYGSGSNRSDARMIRVSRP